MKKLLPAFALVICLTNVKAQFVTIPDANFVTWLQTNVPSAMSGNLMDTTSLAVTTRTNINVSSLGITNLTGVQYFDSLLTLDCKFNQLTNIPRLPCPLNTLNCMANHLVNLPTLPNSLKTLYCLGNNLANLPTLPLSIMDLHCGSNQLTSLPSIPNSLRMLQCQGNQLSYLPYLPDSLNHLECDNNNISCFERFPDIQNPSYFSIYNNPFTCLPNYINAMNQYGYYLNFPLCISGDPSLNPNNCSNGANIIGSIYNDINLDCFKNVTEQSSKNIPIKLYKNTNFISQTITQNNGYYSFASDTGTYILNIDTINKPYLVQCIYPGSDTIINVTSFTILNDSVNFLISGKQNYNDMSIQSILHSGIAFPALQHTISVVAGDIKKWYNLNCATGISGTVSFSVYGPVTYVGSAAGSLVPSVAGNVYTYNIADFGTINNTTAFQLAFQTDITAQAGDVICVNATVTPIGGDNNPTNNSYTYCYNVVNSHDPNIKETYPVDVQPGFNDWLTYTIHFQNTGTAPAFNIRLADTLDAMLDLKTFQIINYSHQNLVDLTGQILNVHFPNIQLPDSTSNSAGSVGFIQYRAKPKATWAAPYKIKNIAYIYFDYNAAIVTNTTYNSILTVTGLKNQKETVTALYPNPTNGTFTIELNTKEKQLLEVVDMTGNVALSQSIENGKATIEANHLAAGIYNISVKGSNSVVNKKLVIVK